MVRIVPSLLSANMACLGDELRAITHAGADELHLDIMDGCFVPNITFGPGVVRALRPLSSVPFDVHLMVQRPEACIPAFVEAGADSITVHAEACTHLDRTLQMIRSFGKKAGVSLVPSTPPEALAYVLEHLDVILVMTVNPGFGGQSFLTSQLPKIRAIRRMLDDANNPALLQVDGGVTPRTAPLMVEAGATSLVAGSSVFQGNPDEYAMHINALRESAS